MTTKTKKKPTQKKRQPRRSTGKRGKHIYQVPKTAAELGIVCTGGNSGKACGLPVVWFDYELGEKNHRSGFVCDDHKVSSRVEKLAQPPSAATV
jgi:hypothetical protein